jgi:VWFA-related protein
MARSLVILILGLTAFLCAIHYSSAQQTQPKTGQQSKPAVEDTDDVVRITTNLVQVDVVVTKDGKIVKGLTADDFEIFEDGRRQTITNFAYISNIPETPATKTKIDTKNSALPPIPPPVRPSDPRRIVALVVDDLGLSAESISALRGQLKKFVDQQMQPNDLVAIIRTGVDMGVLQQFTNDKRLLHSAIKQAQWSLCSRVGASVFEPYSPPESGEIRGPTCGRQSVGSTLSSLRFILQAMGELPGRKSLVIFSDSLPRQEQEASASEITRFGQNYFGFLQRLAEIAIRNSIVIYGVDTQGLQYTGPTAADTLFRTDSLRRTTVRELQERTDSIHRSRLNLLSSRREGAEILARETGGYLVRNSNDFRLRHIMDEQQGYYLIGYRPSAETFNRRFHRISAKVKGSGLTLRTRKGFYGFTEEEAERTQRGVDKTNSALTSPFRANDIAVELATFFADEPGAGPFLRSYLYIEGKDLTFVNAGEDWHKVAVEVRGVIFGNNGQIMQQTTVTPTVRLRGQDYELAMRKGLGLRIDMPVRQPGAYQLRVVAKDIGSSRLGSAGQFITVPNLKNRQLAVSGILLRPESGNEVLSMSVPSVSGTAKQTRSGTPEVNTTPALRRFTAPSTVLFGIVIYNAKVDASKHPKLTITAKLFRDDKVVFAGEPIAVDLGDQKDLARIFAKGSLRLDSTLEPGRYFLQLEVMDSLAKEKVGKVMQWIDFEIVQP